MVLALFLCLYFIDPRAIYLDKLNNYAIFVSQESLNTGSLVTFKRPIMSNINYYTKEGLAKLKAEIKQLKTVERPSISEQIAEARDKGDLSENAEYDAAKEAQGLLEAKISKLETILSNARVLDDSNLDVSKALILSNVTIRNLQNGMELTYLLVAENEADLKEKKISVDSPIGKGLLGKSVGDIADIQVPSGIMKFEILGITR